MTYQLLSIDIWETLISSNPAFRKEQMKLFADFLGREVDNDFTQLKAKIDAQLDLHSQTTGTDVGFEMRLKTIAEAIGYPMILLEEGASLKALYQAMEEVFLANLPLVIDKNTIALLEEVKKRKLKIALLSNTGFIKGKTMRTALTLLKIMPCIEEAVFSDEVGYVKPNRIIFSALEKATKVAPQHILHIGDNWQADVEGAQKAGWQALWLNRNTNEPASANCVRNLGEVLEYL